MKIKPIIKKSLPLILTLTFISGCSYTPKLYEIPSRIKTKIIEDKYVPLSYDNIFSAKSHASKSNNGLEVFVAKYKNKNLYVKQKGLSFFNTPVNELTLGWEVILKDSNSFHRLTNNEIYEFNPEISPDGSYVVFERHTYEKKTHKTDIYKIDLKTKTETRLTSKENCKNPSISQNCESIAFEYNENIWIMDKDGKNQKEL